MLNDLSVRRRLVTSLIAGLGDNLIAVVLYGSRARGTANPDSDWDVLVVADHLPDRTLARHVFVKRMVDPTIRGAVSLIARSPAEIDAPESLPSLYHDIALDGLVLFDRNDFAARWLSELQAYIAGQGLRRSESPYGLMWRQVALPTGYGH